MSVSDLTVSLAEPAELDAATRAAIGTLLLEASPVGLNRFTWDNSVHSVHIIGSTRGRIVGHGLLSRRDVWLDGHKMRAGFAEVIAVAADRRGRGYGTALLSELEALVRAEFEIGVTAVDDRVATTLLPRGWRRWAGTTWFRHESHLTRTPEHDERVYILDAAVPGSGLDGEIAINWRDADVW